MASISYSVRPGKRPEKVQTRTTVLVESDTLCGEECNDPCCPLQVPTGVATSSAVLGVRGAACAIIATQVVNLALTIYDSGPWFQLVSCILSIISGTVLRSSFTKCTYTTCVYLFGVCIIPNVILIVDWLTFVFHVIDDDTCERGFTAYYKENCATADPSSSSGSPGDGGRSENCDYADFQSNCADDADERDAQSLTFLSVVGVFNFVSVITLVVGIFYAVKAAVGWEESGAPDAKATPTVLVEPPPAVAAPLDRD